MSYLREDIERTNLDIPDGEIEIVSAADPVYANAMEVHKKKKEETEKAMAKKEDEVKDGVLGTKGKTTTYPMTKDLKKMKLSEKLFGDYEDSDWKSIDRAVEKDLWTSIYNELNGDMKRLDAKTRRFVRKPSERYSEKDLSTSGDIITVYANDSERLDFAKEVAEECKRVCEFSSRASWSNCARAPQTILSKIYGDPKLKAKVFEERQGYREMLLRRGKAFEEAADECGLEMVPFDAGFFASIPCQNPDQVAARLEKEGIFLVPLAKGLRVSIASVSEEVCRMLPAKILAAMETE